MLEMKGDMAGGAAVLGAMSALRALGCPHVVHGVICAAENMISGEAFRPGDILTAMNGVTIEILSTDAEGRLVLADGLVYTARQGAHRADRPGDPDRRRPSSPSATAPPPSSPATTPWPTGSWPPPRGRRALLADAADRGAERPRSRARSAIGAQRRAVGARVHRVRAEERVQRIDADEVGPAPRRVFDQLAEVGEVADAPVAL